MEINVTWNDINSARADFAADKFLSNVCHCPVARAIKREFPYDVYVSEKAVEVVINDKLQIIPLPDIARTFIELFDAGKHVKPISFTLPV